MFLQKAAPGLAEFIAGAVDVDSRRPGATGPVFSSEVHRGTSQMTVIESRLLSPSRFAALGVDTITLRRGCRCRGQIAAYPGRSRPIKLPSHVQGRVHRGDLVWTLGLTLHRLGASLGPGDVEERDLSRRPSTK